MSERHEGGTGVLDARPLEERRARAAEELSTRRRALQDAVATARARPADVDIVDVVDRMLAVDAAASLVRELECVAAGRDG
jgi:hypothetical protein